MTVRTEFENFFSEASLSDIYNDHIVLSSATGIDNLNQKAFWPILDDQVNIISRKVLSGTYHFSKYKLKLISKGRGKTPREISIPTIRDRIALRALCNFLIKRYHGTVTFELPQVVIRNVKRDIESGLFTGCVKLDISNYYPTIKHSELLTRLRKKIRNSEILELVERAISSPTVARSTKYDTPTNIGVPQGLSISNILAAIYLINVDRSLSDTAEISYYRYVDDVLILCPHSKAESIAKDVIKKLRRLGLNAHDPIKAPEKSKICRIQDKFDYLGYEFENGMVSAREGSIEKLKDSLVSIFTGYKHSKLKSPEFLLWRLNLRITGCVFQNKSKGWLFFFSEINNESLLHNLDRHISKLIDRFNVNIKPKRFVRAYFEIRHNKYETKYIPNFDTYDIDQMKHVLTNYFNKEISHLRDEEIIYEFKKRIDRQARELLTDVQDFGY